MENNVPSPQIYPLQWSRNSTMRNGGVSVLGALISIQIIFKRDTYAPGNKKLLFSFNKNTVSPSTWVN